MDITLRFPIWLPVPIPYYRLSDPLQERSTQKTSAERAQSEAKMNLDKSGIMNDDARRSDRTRWRLLDERGRQTWHYLESDEEVKAWPQTTADKYFLGLDTVRCIDGP